MSLSEQRKPSIGTISRRRTVKVAREELVEMERLCAEDPLPLVVRPKVNEVNLKAWLANHRELVADKLLEHGGLLFRGFRIADLAAFQELIRVLYGELMDYTYRSTPRTQVSGDIYTSTEYPAHETIPMHNEMSYTRQWPMKILFFCAQPAEQGGETPLADSRRMYDAISAATRRRFEDQGVMYVRNYGEGLDLSWQEVFQSEDTGEVESFCRQAGIEYEWKSGSRLRTVQVCQATAVHPKSGDKVWFNQAHLFHVSSLDAKVRSMMLKTFSEDELPRNTYYGDGSPIEEAALGEIKQAYDECSIDFPWQQGDVVLLDNMLVAHGRRPFSGPRKILVGMAQSHENIQVSPK